VTRLTPEEKFRNDLDELRTTDEMVKRYMQEIAKKQQDIDHENAIDERFVDLQNAIAEKQLSYDDMDFPAGSSSMVNNSRKTNKPYVKLEWKPLREIYQNPVLLKDFVAKNLFATKPSSDSSTGIPVLLQTALTSLSQWPQRVRRIVSQVETFNPD
jgi:hypothetical protein